MLTETLQRQCAWCLKIYDFHTKEWKQGPAMRLVKATHGMCPECVKAFKEELNGRKTA